MAIITWFTQPKIGKKGDKLEKDERFIRPGMYSSFYMYDTSNKNFVRIRLELNRPEEGGEPSIFYKTGVTIGFSPSGDDIDKFVACSDNEKDFCKTPTLGYYSMDKNDEYYHLGNEVVSYSSSYLPPNINKDILFKIASYYICTGKNDKHTICQDRNNTVILENALMKLYKSL